MIRFLLCAVFLSTPALAADQVQINGDTVRAGNVTITRDGVFTPDATVTRQGIIATAPAMPQTGGTGYTNADMTGHDFRGQALRGVSFMNTQLVSANFENVDLSGASFINCDLSSANLNGANLSNASLTNVTINGTQMIGTNLTGIKLINTNLSQAITMAAPAPAAPSPAPVTQAAEIRQALTAKPAKGPAKIDLTINFDFNSDQLTAQGREQVAQVAQALKEMGSAQILVQGHTDNVGTDAYNQSLSDRRAASVVRELVSIHHLSASNLLARGYGESQPVDTNDTDLGRAKNRRVTLVNVTKAQ